MYTIYQVEYGDTIDKIANKTNTTRDNIKNINGFNNDEDLIVGSLIIVPKTSSQIFTTYKVKKGDSMYSIAKQFNVKEDTLLLLNGLSKDDYIYPNQEIMVPTKNIDVYVTKEGDTLEDLINNLGVDGNTFSKENGKILVVEDQLVVHKKEEK